MSEISKFLDLIDEYSSSSDEEPQNKVVGGNIFGDAYRGVARKAKSLGKSALDLREKIVKPIKKTAQKVVRKTSGAVIGKDRAKRIERYGDAVLFNTAGLPPSVKEIIRNVGDEPISKIVITRNPVQKVLTSAMNVVSLGSFRKKFDRLPYDDLFHLALHITIPSGIYAVEKNEVITFTKNPKPKSNAEFEEVSPITPGATLNTMMAGSEKIQGDKWTKYDASSNNCQDWVLSMLKGSGMGSAQDVAFIKQDTSTLFKNDSFLRRFARNLTNVGASVATAISGVDDNPIASTPKTTTFEIPSAGDTDVKDGAGRAECPHCGASMSGGTGDEKTGSKGYRDWYQPTTQYTPEDLEVASYLYPPAVYRDWDKLTKAEKKEYTDRTGRPPTPPAKTKKNPKPKPSDYLKTNIAALHERIGKGGASLKMPSSRKKAIIKEAIEFATGDLYRGYLKDPNHYIRAAIAVR